MCEEPLNIVMAASCYILPLRDCFISRQSTCIHYSNPGSTFLPVCTVTTVTQQNAAKCVIITMRVLKACAYFVSVHHYSSLTSVTLPLGLLRLC